MVQSPRSHFVLEALLDGDRRLVGGVHTGGADHAEAAASGFVRRRADLDDNEPHRQSPGRPRGADNDPEEQGVHPEPA